ncbi:MAG: diphthine synthase [archaeon]
MLTFVGLGLYDERSITIAGRDAIRSADSVYAEFYTSRLAGVSLDDLEAFHDVDIDVRDRSGVEEDPEAILAAAAAGEAVFLTAGDTMISTTHVDLRLRAEQRGIETRVIHGTTAQTAASSLTGLQNYRFGKATTVPFEYSHGTDGVPESVIETIETNQQRDLHTLVFLDITVDDEREAYMSGTVAARLLAEHYRPDALGVVVARAGSPDPAVQAGRLADLALRNYGDPLHLLIIPGSLHLLERDALATLADAPSDVLEESLA